MFTWAPGRKGRSARPNPRVRRWHSCAARPALEVLEERSTPCGAGLPLLHSLSGAPTAIYLDFNGGTYGGTTYRPYDVDGNPAVCSPDEQAHITEGWRQVAGYFAMFNADVTTERPTVPFAWQIVSDTVGNGWSGVGVFPNTQPMSFCNGAYARWRTSCMGHEVGHNFGL